jgi:hypothetical protein
LGGIKKMDETKEEGNKRSWPLGLFVECPVCGAKVGNKCSIAKGRNPATPHWSRQKKAMETVEPMKPINPTGK